MADRAEFIRGIRARLNEYHPTRAPDIPWTPERERPEVREPAREELPGLFLSELEAIGGYGARLGDLEAAREYVLELAREREAQRLIRWTGEPLDGLGVDEPLRESGVEVTLWWESEELRAAMAVADIGLGGAEYAVAESGSLLISSAAGAGRSVTLLPPVFVALVATDDCIGSVADVIRAYSDSYAATGELPSSLCFHTGPSRSADIEQSLAIGVHGPGEVHVLLVDDLPSRHPSAEPDAGRDT